MSALLLDVDGVLHVSGVAIPGAAEAVARLRGGGHRLRFVTNNTIRARETLAEELAAAGFELAAGEIETTPLAAARALAGKRVLALTAAAIREDLATGVTLVDEGADAVLLGGLDETGAADEAYGYERLDRAFAELQRGARLVCLHRNRWWQTAAGPRVDAGLYVAGLEYVAGVEAELVGKPGREYFEAALAELGARPEEATMVGDDVETDVGAAMALGLRGVLVRTGKFREETLAGASPPPDAVIDSIADLPGWLMARSPAGQE